MELVSSLVSLSAPLLDAVIAGPFHAYTLHNRDHSLKIIHLAGYLISEETLNALSGLEHLLIIYAAYLHDMGMCLSAAHREQIVGSDEFIQSVAQWPEMAAALKRARISLNSAGEPEKLQVECELFQLQEAALAAYLRSRHASPDYYRDLIKTLIASSGRKDLFQYRGVSFEEQLIDICASHNLNAASLAEIKGLYQEKYPRDLIIAGESVNVQFCAAVLRLADILDFDRERTPKILFESLGINTRALPGAEVSIFEWQKHMAVHTISLEDDEIAVAADCHHPAIEKAIRDFCQMIEREIKDTQAVLRQNPAPIVSRHMIQLPISVRPRIRSIGYVFKNMSLGLNETAVLSLLMGERLYANPAVAVRELIQNSIDACSARAAMDSGGKFMPVISVSSKSDESGRHWITVQDNGIGMDEYVISEYFLKLGNSYYETAEFRHMLDKMSPAKAFVPIARFGIGLASVFMIGDVLELETQGMFSPRHDSTARLVRVERFGALAFVTESQRQLLGTTIRIRVEPRYEASYEYFVAQLGTFLRDTIVSPKYDVRVSFDSDTFVLTSNVHPRVRKDFKQHLPDPRIEVITLNIGKRGDRLRGIVLLLLARNDEGKLSHMLKNKQLRFGYDQMSNHNISVVPNMVVSGYRNNCLAVNGFRMSLAGMTKILGKGKDRIGLAFDLNVQGDESIVYDVARERIMGAGKQAVKTEIRSSIQRGLKELGIYDQLAPSTQKLIDGIFENEWPATDGSGFRIKFTPVLDEHLLLKRVAKEIPSDRWPFGLHK